MTTYRQVKNASVLFLLPSLLMLAAFEIHAQPDNWDVEGENGTIHVHGSLPEGPCNLDMASTRQTIELGSTSTQSLLHVGDRGKPIAMKLTLRDCIRVQSASRDRRTSKQLYSSIQPILTASFFAVANAENPQLVDVNGVSGIGLRIVDSQYRDIRLGDRSEPQFLTPGDNDITYYVVPERTNRPLTPGFYHATVNFALNYD
ncbi:fimbrial protein [Citrobacter sp. FP75]|uniref:fimbrial protein n=1 Tax=Citrobacter sp. FP75 TaxID=1852949 RepID=UPI001FD4BBCC|nr:fimbrial protein [Citrobacter sp. FP75]